VRVGGGLSEEGLEEAVEGVTPSAFAAVVGAMGAFLWIWMGGIVVCWCAGVELPGAFGAAGELTEVQSQYRAVGALGGREQVVCSKMRYEHVMESVVAALCYAIAVFFGRTRGGGCCVGRPRMMSHGT
jgi:hypothetical protein